MLFSDYSLDVLSRWHLIIVYFTCIEPRSNASLIRLPLSDDGKVLREVIKCLSRNFAAKTNLPWSYLFPG